MQGLEIIKELKAKYKNDSGVMRRLRIIEKELKALELLIEAYNCEVFYLWDTVAGFSTKGAERLADGEDYKRMYISKKAFNLLKEILSNKGDNNGKEN